MEISLEEFKELYEKISVLDDMNSIFMDRTYIFYHNESMNYIEIIINTGKERPYNTLRYNINTNIYIDTLNKDEFDVILTKSNELFYEFNKLNNLFNFIDRLRIKKFINFNNLFDIDINYYNKNDKKRKLYKRNKDIEDSIKYLEENLKEQKEFFNFNLKTIKKK